MATPNYYVTDDKGRAWMEVWIGDTAYGVVHRAVREGDPTDFTTIKRKQYAVLDPIGSPHVVLAGVLELPRDLDTDGYGESLDELRRKMRREHEVVVDLIGKMDMNRIG